MKILAYVVSSLIGFAVGHYLLTGAAAAYASILISYHLYLACLVVTAQHDKGLSLPIGHALLTHLAFLGLVVGLSYSRAHIPFFFLLRWLIPGLAPFETKWLFSGKGSVYQIKNDEEPPHPLVKSTMEDQDALHQHLLQPHGGEPNAAMTICSCGNVAEEGSVKCARCGALQTLELKTGASNEEVQNAFDVLSNAWNPDRFEGDNKMRAVAEERLKAIDAAHSLLVRAAVQAAPFRSQAAGARAETPIASPFDEQAAKVSGKPRDLASSDGQEGRPRLPIPLPLLIGCGVVVAGVVTAWLLFKPLDSMLMGTPVAGKVYAEYKAGIRSGVQELENKVGLGVGSAAPAPAPDETPAASTPNPQAQSAGGIAPPGERTASRQPGASRTAASSNGSSPAQGHALPLITAGLTRSEVIAAAGAPTSETADEMDYGNSKLYFDGGVVIGWRIDPSSPVHVKLWPDVTADPDLQSFGMGSTKNEVIIAQGTPTTYSQSMFGYGKSEVYFQYGRVVGWKNDAATPLRTTSR